MSLNYKGKKKDFVKCFSGRPVVFFYNFESRYPNLTIFLMWPNSKGHLDCQFKYNNEIAQGSDLCN